MRGLRLAWRGIAIAAVGLLLAGCASSTSQGSQSGETVAEGGTHRHPAGVLVRVPAGWRISRTPDTMSLTSPDEAVLMMLVVVEAGELNVALRAMDQTLANYLTDAEIRNTHETSLNGMRAIVADGHGAMDGERVEVGIALALSPIGKVLIVLGFARQSAAPETQGEVQNIIRSIRPDGA
jgi:predicted Zn-dependent protease